MPPRARITRKMVVDAALEIVRREGAAALNVRGVAAELGCSTQPVVYCFKTVAELWEAVYEAADARHTEYILAADESAVNPMLAIGLRYIRFAAEERHLFRFLFQSNRFQNVSFRELTQSDGLSPLLAPMCEAAGLAPAQAKAAFGALFISVHGAASLIANNSISYDRGYFEWMLTATFDGAVRAVKGEGHV